jgi:signal transduction histidine kinase
MRQIFSKSLSFIKNNPAIIYSLVLLIFIPVALYFNTYYTLSSAQGDIDIITQGKAVLAENIANLAVQNSLSNPAQLENLIHKVISQNNEVQQMEFLAPNPGGNGFKIIASSEPGNVGQTTNEVQNILAWNQQQGIGFIGTDANHTQRFWKITKTISNAQGQKAGLVSMAVSLKSSDDLMSSTFNQSYFLLLITIVIVFLLVLNNTRLFGYAVTVTRLKEIDEMKDNFVSMASHELRAPLVAIKGNLEFFNDKNKNLDAESAGYLGKIDWSIDRLNSLVNDILEVSRLEGNRVPFEIETFEPEPIIAKLVAESEAQAAGKKLELAYSPENIAPVKADKERFEEILVNLISNALKYTEKGKVEIQTETKNKKLLITVADTGIGISAEDLAKLFEKFYRAKNDQTKKIAGTGLGLWIAREMARKMEGDITVESIKGVGSHFTLHLPLA